METCKQSDGTGFERPHTLTNLGDPDTTLDELNSRQLNA